MLCDEMFAYMKISEMDKLQAEAFSHLPTPVVLPRQAFQDHMAGRCELLPIDKLAGRVSAVGVIPYPPGIPIVMPGESFGSHEEPWLRYILSITKWGQHFPASRRSWKGPSRRMGNIYLGTKAVNAPRAGLSPLLRPKAVSPKYGQSKETVSQKKLPAKRG